MLIIALRGTFAQPVLHFAQRYYWKNEGCIDDLKKKKKIEKRC
jgi:hypothetical protein